MYYIVFDMEWNQPFSKESAVQSPIYFAGEIIQIGAIKLDEQYRAVDCLDLLIAPTFYRKLHHRIKKMTGIDQEQLKGQKRFKAAIEEFRAWCGTDCVMLTWGYDDIQILRDNILMHNLDEDWLPPCLNLQGVYNHQITHENRQFSLESAMERLEIEPTLQAHNAFNDAIYTARVVRGLDLQDGIRNYEVYNGILWNSMHSRKEYFPVFRSKNRAISDPRLRECRCPICGETLMIEVFTQQDEQNFSAETVHHGEVFSIRLKLLQSQRHAWYVRRTTRFL